MNPVLYPAVGALLVLALDLLAGARDDGDRSRARAGLQLGSVAAFALVATALSLYWGGAPPAEGLLRVDGFGVFGVGFVVVAGLLVLGLSLTHFGMARSRPAEPLALLLFAWSGSMVAMVTDHLLVLMVAVELAWLPLVALVGLDRRRLSSSESSLKAFFAHVFASLVFAYGLAFVFGATGRLDFGALSGDGSLLFGVGLTLVLVALLARAAIAPFHPWWPDVHEGAPSFVASHLSGVAQATIFLVLLRILHEAPGSSIAAPDGLGARLPGLLATLGGLALLWGHAMAMVQVRLRRLLGWLGVGQIGFLTIALVDARGEGAHALVMGLLAAGAALTGAMATLGSFSHHERSCDQVGDLGGLLQFHPVRGALLGLFLLSLGGLPGTLGFVARLRTLTALEHGGHRAALWITLFATALALTAVGRPLLAMLRPADRRPRGSAALPNEQVVLLICGAIVVYFGVAPLLGETNLAGQLAIWVDRAVAALRS